MNDSLTNDKDLLAAAAVHDYLLDHPEFFQHYPELISQLRLTHAERGSVSLVERQMELQREKIRALEDDITRLMSVARQNEHIFTALNQLHVDFYKASQLNEIEQALQQFSAVMPHVHTCRLLTFRDSTETAAYQLLLSRRLQQTAFYLGRLNHEEQQGLFGDNIHSVALLLIPGEQQPQALLAFGSTQDDHFQPAMDKLFISHLAELLALILPSYVSA